MPRICVFLLSLYPNLLAWRLVFAMKKNCVSRSLATYVTKLDEREEEGWKEGRNKREDGGGVTTLTNISVHFPFSQSPIRSPHFSLTSPAELNKCNKTHGHLRHQKAYHAYYTRGLPLSPDVLCKACLTCSTRRWADTALLCSTFGNKSF